MEFAHGPIALVAEIANADSAGIKGVSHHFSGPLEEFHAGFHAGRRRFPPRDGIEKRRLAAGRGAGERLAIVAAADGFIQPSQPAGIDAFHFVAGRAQEIDEFSRARGQRAG